MSATIAFMRALRLAIILRAKCGSRSISALTDCAGRITSSVSPSAIASSGIGVSRKAAGSPNTSPGPTSRITFSSPASPRSESLTIP